MLQIFRKSILKNVRWDPFRTGLENIDILGDRPCACFGGVEGIQNTFFVLRVTDLFWNHFLVKWPLWNSRMYLGPTSNFFPACESPFLDFWSQIVNLTELDNI